MPELTKDGAFRKGSRWGVRKVPLDELGDGMFTWVRKLPSSVIVNNKELFEELETTNGHPIERLAEVCTLGICNKSGKQLFTLKDAPRLIDEWPFAALLRCAEYLVSFNRLDETVGAKTKNSKASRRGSSRSGSRGK